MKLAVVLILISSAMKINATSQWMWHGAFPWVYSHAENSWWYMPLSEYGASSHASGWMWHGAFPWVYSHNESDWRYMKSPSSDGMFSAWKQSDKKWYFLDKISRMWNVLPGQNKAEDTFTVPDLGLEMLWVEPGTFTMGSPESEPGRYDDETQHTVTLTEGYWLGKYEVTQAQWEEVMGSNPSYFKGANRPVEKVSWNDVTSFCEKLTEQESEAGRLPVGMAYQLPTEAQWEYACRAGTTTAYSWGNGFTASNANYAYDGWGTGLQRTSDVGQYAANPWGFHDMHGNVWEWCADWHGDYPSGAVRDPVGPAVGVGSIRVSRGGSWGEPAGLARSATRSWDVIELGFRLSLRPVEEAELQDEQPDSSANNAEDTFTVPDLGLEMLWVEPGTFTMGSPESEPGRYDDETQHTVTLTEGYWLGKYEVTQAQWEEVMGSNPSYFKGANRPVEKVSWNDVTSFCEKLTEQESEAGRLPAGMAYQLPTEAQWEYACRAGTTTAFAFGDELAAKNANFDIYDGGHNDVGKYPANAWGFHDMHGNILEWCADWYGAYPAGAASDPVGPAGGSVSVLRGGSWNFTASYARSAIRNMDMPEGKSDLAGFRLSLRLASKAEPQEEQQAPLANKAGDTFTVPDLSLEMLWVEPGTFEMGSPNVAHQLYGGETPHTVTLTEGFYLGKYEVTQAQWQKVMGDNPSGFKGASGPVETVTWTDVTSFCEKLTELERAAGRLLEGMAYQLPTEAQWEYACRAGTKTAFSSGDELTAKDANYAYDGYTTGLQRTANVGQYAANPWGFHDMHGNVWEWCADWWEPYPTGTVRDPVGPAVGSNRVVRGGCWWFPASELRSANRFGYAYGAFGSSILGFRLSLRPVSK